MEHIEKELKEGIKLHQIKTDKFKTNLVAIFLTTSLKSILKKEKKYWLIMTVWSRNLNYLPIHELEVK